MWLVVALKIESKSRMMIGFKFSKAFCFFGKSRSQVHTHLYDILPFVRGQKTK